MSVNKAIILGRLGQDPDTRYMPNGDAVTNISVATSERWKDKQTGELKEKTEWHRVTAYRQQAELLSKHFQKGQEIYLEGRLQTRKWTDKDNVERYTTEIVLETFSFVGSKPEGGQRQQEQGRQPRQDSAPRQQPAQRPAPNFADMDDDIPF